MREALDSHIQEKLHKQSSVKERYDQNHQKLMDFEPPKLEMTKELSAPPAAPACNSDLTILEEEKSENNSQNISKLNVAVEQLIQE